MTVLKTPGNQFSERKRAIFRRSKEIKPLGGGVVLYAAQPKVKVDAAMAEKDRFRLKTKLDP
jgi:hypothetical protein